MCPLLLQTCFPFFAAAQGSAGAGWVCHTWAVCAQHSDSADGNSGAAGCVLRGHSPPSCGVNQGLHSSLRVPRYSSVPGTARQEKASFETPRFLSEDTGWRQQIIAIMHPQKIMVHYKLWGFWILAVTELLSIKPQSVCFHWTFARVGAASLLRPGSKKVSDSFTTVMPTVGILWVHWVQINEYFN